MEYYTIIIEVQETIDNIINWSTRNTYSNRTIKYVDIRLTYNLSIYTKRTQIELKKNEYDQTEKNFIWILCSYKKFYGQPLTIK